MRALLALGVSSLVLAAPASGASKNVEHLTTLPEAKDATAINFLEYERRGPDLDVMLVTGRFGLKSYSLADPAKPALLDELTAEALRLPVVLREEYVEGDHLGAARRQLFREAGEIIARPRPGPDHLDTRIVD